MKKSSLLSKVQPVLRVVILLILVISIIPAQTSHAAGSLFVSLEGSDTNTCLNMLFPCATINGAIQKAFVFGDTIFVTAETYTSYEQGHFIVDLDNKSLSLSGGWNSTFSSQIGRTTIDGRREKPAMQIWGNVTIDNFIITRGYNDTGGGIYIAGSATINNSIFIDNFAGSTEYNSPGFGGGIYFASMSASTLIVNNSLFINNTVNSGLNSNGRGSAIFNCSKGTVKINNSTFTGNDGEGVIFNISGDITITNSTITDNSGDAIYNSYDIAYPNKIYIFSSTITDNSGHGINDGSLGGTTYFQNSIITDNSESDCYTYSSFPGGAISEGYNIIDPHIGCTLAPSDISNIDPLLGPLQNNGGPTQTKALLAGSPAFEAGNPAGCQGKDGLLLTDQRGLPRIGRCDIGAYESQWKILPTMTVTPTQALPGDSLIVSLTVTNGTGSLIQNAFLTDTLPSQLNYEDGTVTASAGIAEYADGVIRWEGNIQTSTPLILSFRVTIAASSQRGSEIVNTAVVVWAQDLFTASATVDVSPYCVYLPLVKKAGPGITGHVTFNNVAAPETWLDLYFYNGGSWNIIESKYTDGEGYFQFNPPSLKPGQAYMVRYLNNSSTGSNGKMAVWFTHDLLSYSSDQAVKIGEFDIGDITLTSPGPGELVQFPVEYRWNRRLFSPGDNYQFDLFDPASSLEFLSPNLGFVDSYTSYGLSAGFQINTYYGWSLVVHDPDGGIGLPYYYFPVAFSNHHVDSRMSDQPALNILRSADLLNSKLIP